jgi:large subunit ribosomal protein L31
MKTEIHPTYTETHVSCTCGNQFTTRSTKGEIHVEICSACHPFYTGRQKLVDTGGRVERFQRRVGQGPSQHAPAGRELELELARRQTGRGASITLLIS